MANCNYKVILKDIQNKYKFKIFCTGNGSLTDYYTKEETNTLLANKEDTLNKVTSMSSSSTDTQYPTAKAVYDSQDAQDTQISNLQEENDYLTSIINQLPKVTGEGTDLTLNNTLNAKMDLDLKGNTYQETTTGKNLYEGSQDFSGTWRNNNNWETDNSTYNGLVVKKRKGSWQGLNKEINIEEGKTYTYSLFIKSDSAKSVAIYTDGGTATISPLNKSITTTTSWARYSLTFTCSASGTIKARLENTADSDSNYTYICGYQLEESSSMTDYEPYTNGASPNPDYPQDIEVVTGNNTIKVEGKNLFDKDNANYVNLTVNTADMRYYNASDNRVKLYYIKCKPNTTYTYSKSLGSFLRICSSPNIPAHNGVISVINSNTTGTSTTITTGANDNYISIYPLLTTEIDTVGYDNVLSTIQIEKGSTATIYEAYQSASYPVNLGSIKLCEIGTYQDRIYKSNIDNNWYLHKEIGKVVLDGTNVSASIRREIANSKYGFCFNYDNAYKSQAGEIGNILCNKLENKTRDNVYNNTQGIAVVSSNDFYGTGCFIYVEDTSTMSLNDFNTWLASNNMIVYYRLATPTETQITDTTLISQLNALEKALAYKNQTNISQTNADKPFIIDASTIYDLSNLVTRVAVLETE